MDNRKYIVFTDIDGTLLDCTRNLYDITDETLYALQEIKKVAYLVLVSGRCKCMITDRIMSVKPDGFILSNGTYAELNGKVVYHKPIKREDFTKITDYCDRTGDFAMLLNQETAFAKDSTNSVYVDFVRSMGVNPDGLIKKGIDTESADFVWIKSWSEEGRKAIEEEFSSLFNINRQQATTFDCVAKEVSKGNTIKEFLKHIDFSYEKSFCFGDGLNDIGMMQCVDYSFAMGNAQEKTKQAAKEVADDALDNGFYKRLVEKGLISPKQ